MDSIIFLSKKAKSYFTDDQFQGNQIIDYFDIEVQKILPFIKFNYKNHPIKINVKQMLDSSKYKYFDLDNFEYIINSDNYDFAAYTCIMYNCY